MENVEIRDIPEKKKSARDIKPGDVYGKLTVLREDEVKDKHRRRWICQCECGNIKSILGCNLVSGNSKTCGCSNPRKTKLSTKDINPGNVYGKLTVLEKDKNKYKDGNVHWLCQCECGNIISVPGYKLIGGRTKSCGCLQHRKIEENPHFKDITGQQFGRLTAIKVDKNESKDGVIYWVCQCECGKTKSVRTSHLLDGSVKSCGCLWPRTGMANSRFIDMTGERFGNLTVLELDISSDKKGTFWLCRCDCGNITSVSRHSLVSGYTKSCGSLNCQKSARNIRPGDVFGKLTVIEKDNNKHKNKKIHWICQCECGKTTLVASDLLISGRTKSCGCLNYRKGADSPHFKDLTGKRFGKLTVIEQDIDNSSKLTHWICRCDCGRTLSVMAAYLLNGTTKSCGCNKESFGETDINEYLIQHNFQEHIDYNRQKTFNDLRDSEKSRLSYDFEILTPIHFFIEYQGRQHYYPVEYFGGERYFKIQQKHDRLKSDYAAKHNIPLYYITYEDNTYEKVSTTMDKIMADAQLKYDMQQAHKKRVAKIR